MYVSPNYRTKKQLKEAVAEGRIVTVYQPNDDFTGAVPPRDGEVSVEGPHYPKPHSWYARVTVKGGRVVKVT